MYKTLLLKLYCGYTPPLPEGTETNQLFGKTKVKSYVSTCIISITGDLVILCGGVFFSFENTFFKH